MTSNKSRQLHSNGIRHHLPPTCLELVLRACPRYCYTESQTGLPDWYLKMKCQGSCCVNLKVCASPESLPPKSMEHCSVVFPPEPTQSFRLMDCFLCFLYIPLAFVNAWHRTLFRTLRKLLLPITPYLSIHVLQVNYFIHFLLFSGLASPKKQCILCFTNLNYSSFPSA